MDTERGAADGKAAKATVAREPMVAKAMEGEGEEDGGGEFQLVTKTSKGKREAPVVTPEIKESTPVSKAGKKRRDEQVVSKTTKSSSAVPKATTKGGAPVVPKTISDKEEPSSVSKTLTIKEDVPAVASKTTKENTPAITKTTPKGDTPVVTKTTTKDNPPTTNKSTKGKQRRPVPAKEATSGSDGGSADTAKMKAAVDKELEGAVEGEVEEEKNEEKNKEGKRGEEVCERERISSSLKTPCASFPNLV